jgi:hypothetical protein
MLYTQRFTIAPAVAGVPGEVQFAIEGDFVRYAQGSSLGGATGLTIRTSNGASVGLTPGSSFKLPTTFKDVRVQNPGPWEVSAELVLGYGESQGATVVTVANTVAVTDPAATRSLQGLAFLAAFTVPATSSTVQLWNPAGSGRLVFVRRLRVDQWMQNRTLWLRNVQIAVSQPTQLMNKDPNATLLQVVARAAPEAVYTPGPGAVPLQAFGMALNGDAPVDLAMSEPFVIRPGWGLTVQGTSYAQTPYMGGVTMEGWEQLA